MSFTLTRFSRIALLSTLSINSAMALPIDWTGVFGVDSHHITNFRRTKEHIGPAEKPLPGNGGDRSGTQAIRSGDSGASFQTYVFKLNPQIIVNDGATLKGELSSGYIRGGFLGDNASNNADGTGNNAYFFNSPAQRSALNVNQMYMELYADTALVKLGRFSKHYGLGVVFDNGNEAWDRFFTMYDGFEAEMKIGNFSLVPSWAKISSYDDTTQSAKPAGSWDVSEMGVVAKYDNKNRDLVVSVLYAKRFAERQNSLYNTTTPAGANAENRGKTNVTIISPFVSKKWNKFKVSAEAPMINGDYGNAYGAAVGKTKISAQSYIVDAKYDLNPKWDIGINAGQVSGDDGESQKFEATYLHPNFHVAELMFRYHYPSFNEGTKNVFDSSITNARYLKFGANYKSDKWTWRGAAIFARALETAQDGKNSYHHEENYRYLARAKQDDDLGYEFDFGFDYRWNPNVTITANYGYWFVGDYYAFSNNTAGMGDLDITNVHGGGVSATLEF